MKKKVFLLVSLFVASMTLSSCDSCSREKTTEEKVQEATEAVVDDVKDAVEETGDNLENALEEAGDAVEETVEDVADELEK